MLPMHLMVNRELSWLEFNKRCLSEALRQDVPLFEIGRASCRERV